MTSALEAIVGRYLSLEFEGRRYRIYFEEAGEGIPLVCLHTAGSDGRQYRGVLNDPEVTRNFRVIAFDMPRHGKSSPPHGFEREEYRLTRDFYTAFVIAFADALSLDRQGRRRPSPTNRGYRHAPLPPVPADRGIRLFLFAGRDRGGRLDGAGRDMHHHARPRAFPDERGSRSFPPAPEAGSRSNTEPRIIAPGSGHARRFQCALPIEKLGESRDSRLMCAIPAFPFSTIWRWILVGIIELLLDSPDADMQFCN